MADSQGCTAVEFAALVTLMELGFQRQIPNPQKDIYFRVLCDLPAVALKVAIERAIAEAKFPGIPMPGVIRGYALDATSQPSIDAAEAWELTRRAIRRFGVYDKAGGLASLPDDVARFVNGLGWNSLCDSENHEVTRSNFIRMWQERSTAAEKQRLIPAGVRAEMSRLRAPADPRRIVESTAAAMKSIEAKPTARPARALPAPVPPAAARPGPDAEWGAARDRVLATVKSYRGGVPAQRVAALLKMDREPCRKILEDLVTAGTITPCELPDGKSGFRFVEVA